MIREGGGRGRRTGGGFRAGRMHKYRREKKKKKKNNNNNNSNSNNKKPTETLHAGWFVFRPTTDSMSEKDIKNKKICMRAPPRLFLPVCLPARLPANGALITCRFFSFLPHLASCNRGVCVRVRIIEQTGDSPIIPSPSSPPTPLSGVETVNYGLDTAPFPISEKKGNNHVSFQFRAKVRFGSLPLPYTYPLPLALPIPFPSPQKCRRPLYHVLTVRPFRFFFSFVCAHTFSILAA